MRSAARALIFLMVLFSGVSAQLKEFLIVPEQPPEVIPVFTAYPKDAAVIISSSITTLSFSSNTGGLVDVTGDPNQGRYNLIVRTEKQYITVKSAGFREGRIQISGMKPKDVRYYSIEEKIGLQTDEGRVVLNSLPQGAEYQFAGYPITGKTPADFSVVVGTYKVIFSKPGYKEKEIVINVEKGGIVNRTVELKMDIEAFGAQPAIITDITPIGGLINSARVEALPDAINVYYSLPGAADQEYEVTLVLKSRLNPDYLFEPELVSGDIGEGTFAGDDRKIVWRVKDELGAGFDTEGKYFELNAQEIGGGIPWYVWVLGGLGGGAAAYFATQKKDAGTVTGSTEIPGPPGRPGN